MQSDWENDFEEEDDRPSAIRGKKRVLFVCLGNICRSPAAEGIFRRIVEERDNPDRWVIDSAGLGNWHQGEMPDGRMRVHALRRGLNLTHLSRPITSADFDDFDLIIGMDESNMRQLKQRAPSPEAEKKLHRVSEWMGGVTSLYDHVPDPYYEGSEGFELVLNLLDDAMQRLYDDLKD